MVDDVAAGGGAGHYRRVGYRGDVVAEDGAAEERARDERHVHAHVYRHRQRYDGHYRHCAHRGACREREHHRDDEGQQRQQLGDERAHEYRREVVAGVELLDERTHREAEEQDAGDGQHRRHALEHFADEAFEVVELFGAAHDGYDEDGDHAAPEQRLHSVAGGRVAVAGDYEDGEYDADHRQHRDYHVFHARRHVAFHRGHGLFVFDGGARVVELAGRLGAQLGSLHRAEVERQEGREHGEYYRDYAVEVERYRAQQRAYRLALGDAAGGEVAGHGGEPAAEREEDAPRRRGGVDEEGRLLVRNLHRVVERARDGAGDHAAERAGGENDDAEQPREEGRGLFRFDDSFFLDHDVDEAVDAARVLDEINQSADEEHRHYDYRVAAALKGVDDAVESAVDSRKYVPAAQYERGERYADEERDEDVLDDERERYRHDRRHNGPKTEFHFMIPPIFLFAL